MSKSKKKEEEQRQGVKWCGTLNNYTDEDVALFRGFITLDSVAYVLFGYEIAPETNTPHLQFYIHLKKKKGLAAMKKLHGRAHYEMCKGTEQENMTYCKKGGKWEEFGEIPIHPAEQAKIRWQTAFDLAVKGKIVEIEPQIIIHSLRNLELIHNKWGEKQPRLTTLDNVWVVGDSGCGKSHWVREQGVCYDKMPNKWWDNYAQEDIVHIEDFDKSHAYLSGMLKRWADVYPFKGEAKGSSMDIRPKRIFVSSQYSMEEIFGVGKDLDALKRRFKEVWFKQEMRSDYIDPKKPKIEETYGDFLELEYRINDQGKKIIQ